MLARSLLGLIFFATALCAQVPNSVYSPPNTRSLALRDCINLALGHNLNLQIQHLKVDVAASAVSGAYGPYDPSFVFSATKHFIDDPGDFDPRKFNPYFPSEISKDELKSELTGKVPFGFSYDFGGSVWRNAAVTDFRSNPEDAALFPGGIRTTNSYDASVGLTMRQHLLKDFWIDTDREVLLARRTELKISREALRFQIMTTLLGVELAYYDLLGAREEVAVQEKLLGLRKRFVAETQRRVQVGDLPPLEDAQAQAQLQNTLTALASAREKFSSRQNALVSLLADDFKEWTDVNLEAADALKADPVEINRAHSFESAMTRRPDLIEARLAVEKSATMVKFLRNQLFPSVDVVGGYGGLGSTISSGGAAFNQAIGFSNPEYSYGVVVSLPLGNIAARSSYRASKAAKDMAELELKKAEQDVLLQVSDFLNRIDARYSQVASTHQARIYAESALDAEAKKLANGFTTSFTVLQYQEVLTAASSAEIQAKVDYNKLLAQLAFAEGATLDRHHLSLEVR
jgi:outer membrane protein TolC